MEKVGLCLREEFVNLFFKNPKRGSQLDLWFISDHYDSKTNKINVLSNESLCVLLPVYM